MVRRPSSNIGSLNSNGMLVTPTCVSCISSRSLRLMGPHLDADLGRVHQRAGEEYA